MKHTVSLVLLPEEAADEQAIRRSAAGTLDIPVSRITTIRKIKRSIDARGAVVKILLQAEICVDEPCREALPEKPEYPFVHSAPPVLIAGAGPAGLFAAMRLIELGLRPVIIERGKDVRSRRRDLAAINRQHVVNPDSNYCFGEGGAGTYSDGKLYTRSTKRGDVNRILQILVWHGASEEIRIDAHPHIGTNKLPKLIGEIRQTILDAGGEIHFHTRLTQLIIHNGRLNGIEVVSAGNPSALPYRMEGKALILATGHSARDVFHLLHHQKILIEAKPFALGVRAEHPQEIIDRIQYHCDRRSPFLPAASYKLVQEVDGKGVYSFCMCPGGFMVPSATENGQVVVNGMSPSRRDSRFANSGIVVAVEPSDLVRCKMPDGKGSFLHADYSAHGPLAALLFQQDTEQAACRAGGGTQAAPAQRMEDFVKGRLSSSLPITSYQPGVTSADLSHTLPDFVASRLREAFKAFGKKMKGYFTNEAILTAVESRTSSPVRIPRDAHSLQHPQVPGLFPCGEGAGYAGGIVSAAMDGERCAEACARMVLQR